MNPKKIVIIIGTFFCSGLFYEVDKILAYYKWATSMTRNDISSFSHVQEVGIFDNFFSVLLLIIGFWLLFQEVNSYIKGIITKRKNKK